jgi:hypothetical protein
MLSSNCFQICLSPLVASHVAPVIIVRKSISYFTFPVFLYLDVYTLMSFPAYFCITFLFDGITTSISKQLLPSFLSDIMSIIIINYISLSFVCYITFSCIFCAWG